MGNDTGRVLLWMALAFVAGGLVTYGLKDVRQIDCEKTCKCVAVRQ